MGTRTAPVSTRLAEVAPGVYAYVQTPGGWCVSNAGVIAGGPHGAVVIDTLATAAQTGRLRAAVDALGTGPRRIVVNTHHHGDHVFGNHAFDAATIIAHENAPAELTATGLALTGLWPAVDWGDVRVTLPTVTFAERLRITLGEHTAELLHPGPAHTNNDVVVWLPERRVLFAGDVALSGCTPFLLMGSVTGALRALRGLRELDARVVVCGHGPVTGPQVLDENIAYLHWLLDVAEAGRAAGRTPLQAARDARLGHFAELLDPERLVGNLHRAYAELAGAAPAAALDVAPVFAEMIDYNDGVLPTCLA